MKRIKSFFRITGNILVAIVFLLLHPFEWVFNQVKYKILARREVKRFNRAKKEADQKHAANGKRFHVLPYQGDKLVVVDNTYIDHYNKVKGVKKINIHTLLKMAYYSTN